MTSSPADARLAELTRLIESAAAERPRPLEQWQPSRLADIGLEITADGLWHYQDSPIRRPTLVKLFASILRREADGKHYLVTPAEKVLVRVADAPLLAVELWAQGAGSALDLSFRTNLDDVVLAGPDQPFEFRPDPKTAAPRPYIHVRHGLLARATRSVYLEIVEHGSIETRGEDRQFGVWSRGAFFAMASAEAVE
jgi:hypothetical protein